jgi:outer membrane lipopolysaccharide assembly protein LptE/RlpB
VQLNPVARLSAVAALVASTVVLAACGYSLAGRGSFLPDTIKVIAVPPFTNRTPLFNLETQMTEKVRAEFIGRGKYRIVQDTQGADAVLSGELSNVNIAPLSFTGQQLASRYVVTMAARVELRDLRENKVLWENPGLIFRQEYDAQSGQTALDPTAFFGQDQNALERMTSDFSRSIVSAILEAF